MMILAVVIASFLCLLARGLAGGQYSHNLLRHPGSLSFFLARLLTRRGAMLYNATLYVEDLVARVVGKPYVAGDYLDWGGEQRGMEAHNGR